MEGFDTVKKDIAWVVFPVYSEFFDSSNKKIWEELTAYIIFTIILISDRISRKKMLVCMSNEANKTIKFWRLHC
jgi:hypothetical protein